VGGTTLFTVAQGSTNTNTINIGEIFGSDAATFALTNGITRSNPIIVRSGSTGGRTIQSLSTSGTNTLSGLIRLSNNTTFDSASGGTLLVSGSITNTGQLTKSGAGRLLLTASNSYSGGTVISAGTLAITNGNALCRCDPQSLSCV
jgi:autotransporter-associated beta strand protein